MSYKDSQQNGISHKNQNSMSKGCPSTLFSKTFSLMRLSATRVIFLALIMLTLLWNSCAYYNTFYNAQKEYKAAEIERQNREADKPTAKENQAYKKAIEKASKILEIYPDSKYVDDALLILGKCFFYQQQYGKAERKFEEVLSLFGDGELADEALLYRAKSRKEQRNYDQALADCQELLRSSKNEDIIQEAQFYLGEILFARQDYSLAIDAYNKTLDITKDKELRFQTYTRLGESHLALKQYAASAEAYRSASKSSSNLQKRYKSLLEMSTALKLDGNHAEAVKTLNKLLNEETAKDYWADVNYQVAESIFMQGDIDNAVKWYKSITEDYAKTEAAARAYFQLGSIYESHYLDFKKAKENYDQVKMASQRALIIPSAEIKSADIGKLLQLRTTIANLEKTISEIDSTGGTKDEKVAPDSTAVVKIDTTQKIIQNAQSNKISTAGSEAQKTEKPKDIQQLKSELGAAYLQLAELYLFQFSQPDSALTQYQAAYGIYPEGTVGTQALYSIAYIHGKIKSDTVLTDSLLTVLVTKFPDTPQADEARRKLKLPQRHKPEDILVSQFHEAEEALWIDNNLSLALQLYADIGRDTVNADFAAKALFSKGWIEECKLFDNTQAYKTYKQLLETYPQSKFAQKVKSKIDAFENHTKQDTTGIPDSTAVGKKDSISTNKANSAGGTNNTKKKNTSQNYQADSPTPVNNEFLTASNNNSAIQIRKTYMANQNIAQKRNVS